MNNLPYIDILILAMIAIFIINRLKNTLGKKTGNESDIIEKFTQKKSSFKESKPDSVSSKSNEIGQQSMHKDKRINSSLNEILKLDNNFNVSEFLDGAKKAFEYILSQYSKNDLKSLEKLLSKTMLEVFQDQIQIREKNLESLEITVISVKDPEILNVKIEKNHSLVLLSFDSEQVQITKDKKGIIVDGDSNQILSIKENWTFSKNLKSKDPNWTLEKIEENI